MGKVTDPQGQPLGGVRLVASSATTTSNEQGFFSLDKISETDRLVVNFEKEGYVPTSVITKIQTGMSSFLEPVMAAYKKRS